MRGDWIHDWVRVEMEYRAGPAPAGPRERPARPASRPWKTLWAALFESHRPGPAPTGKVALPRC
ncbi:hypothetical protein DMA12_16465 [Amycolatopsis balhimycina DSM 5908]|uniref:Uncharacterized protein n=1 Tax=Amycolatopsis balhimycina DSM 5908 TaxID=1081091 RepID=A0A428WN23_AMYBA|nr:hypothetical protein [Amycolatopsis balhimycina]RSM44420.1 hypothetical protein DMA12_16465 [Amycolatopsis balhimycina DSM 5908]